MAKKPAPVQFDLKVEGLPTVAEALRTAAPKHLLRQLGRAFYRIGRSDIDKLKAEQLSGGSGKLNIRRAGLKKAFKHKSADARKISRIGELWLSEYTGWKQFRIFQTGGTVLPRRSRMLTVLAPAARNSAGKRKMTQKQLKAAIRSGELQVLQTKSGPIVVKNESRKTKKGKLRKGSRMEIIAYLVPRVKQKKRLSFYENFERNKANHDRLLSEAARLALEQTAAEMKNG